MQHNRVLEFIPAPAIAVSIQDESEKWWLAFSSLSRPNHQHDMVTEINLCLATVVVACLVSPLPRWSWMGNPWCHLFAFLPVQQNVTAVAEAFGYSVYSKLLQVSRCPCCSGEVLRAWARSLWSLRARGSPFVSLCCRAGRGAAAAAGEPCAQTLHAALAHGRRLPRPPGGPAEVPVPQGAPRRAGLLPQSTHHQGHQGKCDSTRPWSCQGHTRCHVCYGCVRVTLPKLHCRRTHSVSLVLRKPKAV